MERNGTKRCRSDMTNEQKGMTASIVGYVIFGFSYLFSKMALGVAEPMILLSLRFTVTFIVLNLLVLTKICKVQLKGKPIGGAILLGLLQPVLYFILENYGLKYTTTSFTGIISSVSPIFTTILGALILRERPNWKQWLGIVLSIAGVMMVSIGGSGGENTVVGCVCLILAYLAGGFYSILARKLANKFTPFELTYVMFVIGFLSFIAWAFVQYRGETLAMYADALSHGRFIIAILYLGILASICAYFLMNYSYGKLPVARVTVFGNISTVVSVVSGILIMGDTFTWISGAAFVLILGGIWVVNRFKTPETEE